MVQIQPQQQCSSCGRVNTDSENMETVGGKLNFYRECIACGHRKLIFSMDAPKYEQSQVYPDYEPIRPMPEIETY